MHLDPWVRELARQLEIWMPFESELPAPFKNCMWRYLKKKTLAITHSFPEVISADGWWSVVIESILDFWFTVLFKEGSNPQTLHTKPPFSK